MRDGRVPRPRAARRDAGEGQATRWRIAWSPGRPRARRIGSASGIRWRSARSRSRSTRPRTRGSSRGPSRGATSRPSRGRWRRSGSPSTRRRPRPRWCSTDPSDAARRGKAAPPPRVIPLQRRRTTLTAELTLTKGWIYRIEARTADGRVLPKNRYRIDVREDRAPRVASTSPTRRWRSTRSPRSGTASARATISG